MVYVVNVEGKEGPKAAGKAYMREEELEDSMNTASSARLN